MSGMSHEALEHGDTHVHDLRHQPHHDGPVTAPQSPVTGTKQCATLVLVTLRCTTGTATLKSLCLIYLGCCCAACWITLNVRCRL